MKIPWLSKRSGNIKIIIYSKPGCHLCDEAKAEIVKLRSRFTLEIHEVNVEEDPSLSEKYRYEVPVVFINGRKVFKYKVDGEKLARRLRRE